VTVIGKRWTFLKKMMKMIKEIVAPLHMIELIHT